MKRWHAMLAAALIGLVAACGGGGDGAGDPAAPPVVARVEIVQSGALLTQPGDSKQLAAVAYDAEDRVIDTPIAWRSNTPAQIGVDAGGAITALAAAGSSLITAESGGVRSVPLLAVAAQVPAGTLTLTDAQIVGDPVATDPGAAPSFANTYRVVLAGVAAPAVGQLIVNTESKPVGGRVVAVQPGTAGQYTVTLKLASLREMFTKVDVRQTLDLANAPLTIDPQIAASYDVQRSGATLRFTPKPGTFDALRRSALGQRLLPRAAGRGLGLFETCETTLTGLNALPIQLVQPPIFSLTKNLALDVVVGDNGLERLVAHGGVGVTYDGTLEVVIAFEGSISCEKEVATIRIPVGGFLSFIVGGIVPVSLGLEASGKMTLASAKLGLKAEANAQAELGMACPAGSNCAFVASLGGSAEAGPEYELPAIEGNVRFEPELAVFGKLEMAIGNPFLKAIRFNAFEASMGPKLAGSFAPHAHQIADTQYKSSYGLSFDYKAGLGSNLDDALEMLGVDRIDALELSESLELGRSPKGTVEADRLSFAAGDTVNFRVMLDPATLDFVPLVVPDNVRDVVLMRKAGGNLAPHEVSRIRASAGQDRFDFAFTASDDGSAAEFTAFVVTSLLPLDVFALEIGSATAHAIGLRMPATIATQGSASATVTVTRTDEQGGSAPAAGRFVALSSDCGRLSPAGGRTDAHGNLIAQVTPAGCATAIAVTAVASDNEGTPALARTTATAAVAAVADIVSLNIDVGGRTLGQIVVWVWRSDGSDETIASVPTGEAGSLQSLLDAVLAGTTRLAGGFGVSVSEPVNLLLDLPNAAGGVTVGGRTPAACRSSIEVRVGEGTALGAASVGGCLGRVALTLGDVDGRLTVNAPDTEVSVTTGKVRGAVAVAAFGATTSGMTANIRTQGHNDLSVRNLEDSTVNVQGRIERQPGQTGSTFYVGSNTNLRLGPLTGGDITYMTIERTTFAAAPAIAIGNLVLQDNLAPSSGSVHIVGNAGLSLSSISIGNVVGDLEIGDNRGFSNTDASAFAQARSVGGTTRISGNSP